MRGAAMNTLLTAAAYNLKKSDESSSESYQNNKRDTGY